MIPDPFAALAAQGEALEQMLESLDDEQWKSASACAGWSIEDVVLHLAQTEEVVIATAAGRGLESLPPIGGDTVDEAMASWVERERGAGPRSVLERWKDSHRRALEALTTADPHTGVPWIAGPLKPRTLATTRLSEHWIHTLDIAGPLDIAHPDTARLWHLAWLAHRTLPYAYMRANRGDAPDVRLELESPDGEMWEFGGAEAACRIRGSAGEFCRVAGRRLGADQATTVDATGPGAAEVLELVRLYA